MGGENRLIYEDIFEGSSSEAVTKFPFLENEIHLKVLQAMSTNMGIFPKKNTFYVVTYQTLGEGRFNVIIEEVNSISTLNSIMKRETYGAQYLDEGQIMRVEEFLKENNCEIII
jgi:hypothetical protein